MDLKIIKTANLTMREAWWVKWQLKNHKLNLRETVEKSWE